MTRSRRYMTPVVALLILAGFLGALAWLLAAGGETTAEASAMLEALKAAFLLAVGYYLGSSEGSARKTELFSPEPPPQKPPGSAPLPPPS